MSTYDAGHPFRAANIYEDPEIYELEADAIFRGDTWHHLTFDRELLNVGDFITTDVGPEPVVVDRAADAVHAFVNRCAHQGAIIVRRRRGNATKHVCDLHRWAYDLSGAQIDAAGSTAHPRCLRKLQVGSLFGLAFGSFRPSAGVQDYLGAAAGNALHDLCGRRTRTLSHRRCRINANWKRYVQALFDSDGYFGVLPCLRPGKVELQEDGGHAVWSSPYERANGISLPPLDHLEVEGGGAIPSFVETHSTFQSLVLFVYPSLVIARIANHLQLRLIVPQAPGCFDLVWTNLAYEDDSDDEVKVRLDQADIVGLGAPLAAEDLEQLEALQRSRDDQVKASQQTAPFWERYERAIGSRRTE
jgi:anthranilate 1,2-dioxygenase large subunit